MPYIYPNYKFKTLDISLTFAISYDMQHSQKGRNCTKSFYNILYAAKVSQMKVLESS